MAGVASSTVPIVFKRAASTSLVEGCPITSPTRSPRPNGTRTRLPIGGSGLPAGAR